MANGQYIGVNGVARKVTTPYIGVEGVARKVAAGYVGVNGVARLFFAPESGNVVMEVEKKISNVYVDSSTTYENEEFILIDVYPKSGGTVTVTYEGLTKTITDTSGAEEPNSQQVFFGTFKGVSDSVATPSSGTLTVEGDYYAVGVGTYNSTKMITSYFTGVKSVRFGACTYIPANAFRGNGLNSVTIPGNVKEIGISAFASCLGLKTVTVKEGVERIGINAFKMCQTLEFIKIPASVNEVHSNPFLAINRNCPIAIDDRNSHYRIDGNCLVEVDSKTILSGFLDSVIPDGTLHIALHAFDSLPGLTTITIPASVEKIGIYAFSDCTNLTTVTILRTTPPDISGTENISNVFPANCTIIVPKGCGDTYKNDTKWSEIADRIVEAS